jgi:hypothetical protein
MASVTFSFIALNSSVGRSVNSNAILPVIAVGLLSKPELLPPEPQEATKREAASASSASLV